MDYLAEIAAAKLPFEPVDMPRAKRVFDIIMAALLILLLSPLILLILILFFLEQIFAPSSRGPLFYSETRISKGRPFKIFKFRIFKIQSSQNYFKEHGYVETKAVESDKNNLTFTGKVLKQIYMDEFPQLYNVLKGDMTLVGPRPSNIVVTWQDGKEGRFQRYLFTCGLTGPFQVIKDSKVPHNQSQIDMGYIQFCKNNPGWRVVLKDLNCLLSTIFTVIRAKGV
jgi:lipopolysaccharide/colanic/teichoic acid biosynthesis glycosyltransferase